MNLESSWTVYRTRFLVRACRLTEALVFTDALGREQSGRPGDYLVETSEGLRRIIARGLFEDIYVPLAQGGAAAEVSGLDGAISRTVARAIPSPIIRSIPRSIPRTLPRTIARPIGGGRTNASAATRDETRPRAMA